MVTGQRKRRIDGPRQLIRHKRHAIDERGREQDPAAELERFYEETRPIGRAFGIPDALLPAALGTVANVRGTLTGTGRIAWDERGTVTSNGRRNQRAAFTMSHSAREARRTGSVPRASASSTTSSFGPVRSFEASPPMPMSTRRTRPLTVSEEDFAAPIYTAEVSALIAEWRTVAPQDEPDARSDGDWLCQCQDWNEEAFTATAETVTDYLRDAPPPERARLLDGAAGPAGRLLDARLRARRGRRQRPRRAGPAAGPAPRR